MDAPRADADRRLETTLHDGVLERIDVEGDEGEEAVGRNAGDHELLELVIDVPFVRAHHERPKDHRYLVRCEHVVAKHLLQWVEETKAFREVAWRDEPVLAIVHVYVELQHGVRLRLEGHTDKSVWTALVIDCARVTLAESDGTRHDLASFEALGRAYWDAWSASQQARTDREGGA
ncbi:MAG: hypothetical protein J0L92_06810 [Deltaproteobacteria bacterium]|nr:hypothetical protein [Deltaproteobacteria bacterium]